MLLVIHNLPATFRYGDVKTLITEKCGLTEMIVDNLVTEGTGKKVTVGLADEGDAAILVRKINGLYLFNHQLHVEDVRHTKNSDQPYRPNTINNQYQQVEYNDYGGAQSYDQFGGPQDALPYQSSSESVDPGPAVPNFGLPFYMTAQTENVGNNLHYMVQYPKPQGRLGNERYEGSNIGFDEHGGRERRGRYRSPDRSPHTERSSRPSQRWNEPENDRSDGRRGRDYDDRRDSSRSYKDKSSRDSFQNRSLQDQRSDRRYERPSNRSESKFDRRDRSPFNRPDEHSRGRHYNEDKEPQRFMEDNLSKSRDSDYDSRPGGYPKKRPYESADKNKFAPKYKKFGNNQHFESRHESDTSDNLFYDNFQNKSDASFDVSPMRSSMQQSRPSVQTKGPNMQPKVSLYTRREPSPVLDRGWDAAMEPNRPHTQPKAPYTQPSKPQMQPNAPYMKPPKSQMQAKGPFAQPLKKQMLPKTPYVQPPNPQIQPKAPYAQTFKPQMQQKSSQNNDNKPKLPLSRQGSNNQQTKSTKQSELSHSAAGNVPTKLLPQTLARYEAWRVQAASVIANQILNNMRISTNKRNPITIKLKECVRARIDVITDADVSYGLGGIISRYRLRFQDDVTFYNAVRDKVNADPGEYGPKKAEANNVKAEVTDKSEVKAKSKVAEKPPVNIDLKPLAPGTVRIPSYPEGNKKVMSQMKKAQKEEIVNDSLYTMDPVHEQALEEELDSIDQLIKNELENPETNQEKSINKCMKAVFETDLRKLLTLNIKKRVLNIKTNLSVRLTCQPKPPKRDAIQALLKDRGVISLKKSERRKNIFIATCDSYESFDALCKESTLMLDTIKISIKPLHFTPPMPKGKSEKQPGNANNRNEENTEEFDDGDVVDSTEVNKPSEDSECEIITDNKNEDIIVIEDNVQKIKDVIVIDENEDRFATDNEGVIHLDDRPDNTDTEVVTGDEKEATIDNQSVADASKEQSVGDKDSDRNDIETADLEEIMDSDNIAEDDLEDF